MKRSSYQTKKHYKKRNRLQASNAAHARLEKRAEKRRDEKRGSWDLNEQLRLYHGACICRQEKAGRVFTRAERKKVYNDVIKDFF